MEKLNLDKTWQLCLEMWEWIVKEIKAGSKQDVGDLKWEWLRNHKLEGLLASCFFCSYADIGGGRIDCDRCPGYLAERGFDCGNGNYAYDSKPIEFLAELKRRNKLRKRSK